MSHLGWALIQHDQCPYKKREFIHKETLEMCTHPPSKDTDQQEAGHLQDKKRDLKIKQIHHHLDPEFPASRLWENECQLFLPHSLWYFVILAYPFSRGSFQPGIELGSPALQAASLPSWAMTEAHAGPQGLVQTIPNSNIHKNHLEALLNTHFGALLSEFLFIRSGTRPETVLVLMGGISCKGPPLGVMLCHYYLQSINSLSTGSSIVILHWDPQIGSAVKNPPAKQETWVWSLGWEDPLEEETATSFSICA